MENKAEAGGKLIWKLSFCPFCQYSRSNNPSYMNHIICRHYNTNYGCGKCLDEVYITGQPLYKHMKTCKGLLKEAADKATAEDTDSASSGERRRRASQRIFQKLSGELTGEPMLQPEHQGKSHHNAKKPDSSSKSSCKKEKCSSSHKHRGKSSKDKDKPSKHHTTKSIGTSKDKCSETSKDRSSEHHKTKSSGTSKESPVSTTAKASPPRRSKVASPDMGDTPTMSHPSSCRISSCFTVPHVACAIS